MRFRSGFVVAAYCILVIPSRASAPRPPSEPRGSDDRPTVRVSRHELRIVFPRDTARRWGWSAPLQPDYVPLYSWAMDVDAIEGPRTIRLAVSSVPVPRQFRSLRELVSAGRGHLCSWGMATICVEIGMRGVVERGRVVLTLRDSTLISWLFALQPKFVTLSDDRSATNQRFAWDSVRIEYVAPGVRPLDSATRSAALGARRRESRDRFSVSRGITGGRGFANEHMWLIVGDSVPLWLTEIESSYDTHVHGQRDLTDSGWTVLDARVAQLLPPLPGAPLIPERFTDGPPRMYVKALSPGLTTIRVRGVHGRLDAAIESELPPGVLERTLVVVRPPKRLEIAPRPDTLRVGQYLWARVRVYDAAGDSTDRVPVELVCIGCIGSYYDGVQLSHIWSNEPGRITIVARLGGLADTLNVVVVDSAIASKRR